MKAEYSKECPVEWKFCEEHDFTYLYGNRCPNCIAGDNNMSSLLSEDEYGVVVGMTKQEALDFLTSKEIKSRIIREDTESFAMTMDFNPDRINLEVDNNKIVDYSRG